MLYAHATRTMRATLLVLVNTRRQLVPQYSCSSNLFPLPRPLNPPTPQPPNPSIPRSHHGGTECVGRPHCVRGWDNRRKRDIF